jgi:hypothetical protein
MWKWLLCALVVLSLVAQAAAGAVVRDRDHDGMPDRWERRHHVKFAKRDPDRDGLRNRREYRLRTKPHRRDTDRDGLRDGAEVRRWHTNPRKRDTDGDGWSDGAEVRRGTNPRNRNSHPPGTPAPPASPPGGFPNASNTGVPAGTTLTASGALTINTAGAVVDAREITGAVVVNAPNVTIRRSRIRSNAFRAIENNSTGLVVEDSEILNRPVSGQPNCHNAIGWGAFTVRRSEIAGCENAADLGEGNATLVDNYIHDLDTTGPSAVFGDGPHTDGIQIGQGASNLVIRHNWIDPTAGSGATSGIIMYTGSGTPNSSVWIEDNYIDGRGASYAIYAPRSQTHDVYINRNQMLRGVYGYTACVRPGVTVSAFDANKDNATAAPISPDNGAGNSCNN